MKRTRSITTLFVDIGGVLLTDGWNHGSRKLAAKTFALDYGDLDERHRLTFDAFEEGKITLEEYLSRIVFYQKRPFSKDQFRRFMFAQSQPFPEMIEMIRQLKAKYKLKIAVVSNEGRKLNSYRVQKFHLTDIIDFFISSSFVHVRKPDADIFRLALDISQTPARNIIYIENTPMFVQIAEGLGIASILHKDYRSTRAKLAEFGLTLEASGKARL